MDQGAADRVPLLLLDHHRRRPGAVELEVDQRAAASECHVCHALIDLERARLLALAVDDARHQPGASQATAGSRAELAALRHPQGRPVVGHGRSEDS
jgi:hypothetical protein